MVGVGKKLKITSWVNLIWKEDLFMKVPTSSSDAIPDMLFGKFVKLVLFSWITDVKPNIWNLQLLYSSVSQNLFELFFFKSFFMHCFTFYMALASLVSINIKKEVHKICSTAIENYNIKMSKINECHHQFFKA